MKRYSIGAMIGLLLFISLLFLRPSAANVIVTDRLDPSFTPIVLPVRGDRLTGDGNVTRTILTYDDLMTGSSTAPVDDSAFTLPANAAMPEHTFEGRFVLSGEAIQGDSRR